MTNYAIGLLPTKMRRESVKQKGWSDWNPITLDDYGLHTKESQTGNWLTDYEHYPLYALKDERK